MDEEFGGCSFQEIQQMMVYTCTEISAGKELCVRYIDTRGTFSYRQYMLQDRQPTWWIRSQHLAISAAYNYGQPSASMT